MNEMEEVYDAFRKKTVLVTGGAGAIGGNLVRALNELETNKIIILDNLSSSYEWKHASRAQDTVRRGRHFRRGKGEVGVQK